jgi:hypothetical protein
MQCINSDKICPMTLNLKFADETSCYERILTSTINDLT